MTHQAAAFCTNFNKMFFEVAPYRLHRSSLTEMSLLHGPPLLDLTDTDMASVITQDEAGQKLL